MKPLALLAALCALLPGTLLHAQTSIRPDPTGKRLLYVLGKDILPDPTGNRLLYVDGNNIRPSPTGDRLLYVDSDGDVRPDPTGVRLAHWSGNELRKGSANGPRIGLLDDKDFRPEPGYNRYFYIDGPPLSRMQLTAVLYQLHPEFFAISAEEKAAKEKEMKDNAAEELAAAQADALPGDHRILSHWVTKGPVRKGSVVITKQGTAYLLTFKTGDATVWSGIGLMVADKNDNRELWAAVAPGGATSLGIYEINGGELKGSWLPINGGKDPAVLGFENLSGSPQIGGAYKITSGKLPNGGVAYSGALNIDPLQETLNEKLPCYRFRWATGTSGLAFRSGNRLAVAAGWGPDVEIMCLGQENADFQGNMLSRTGGKGFYSLLK